MLMREMQLLKKSDIEVKGIAIYFFYQGKYGYI